MQFHIFTDGACSGNPGPGGWGVWATPAEDGRPQEPTCSLWGGASHTTNNRMELEACLQGLIWLWENSLSRQTSPGPYHATLWSDSQYVVKGMTQWIFKWEKNHWRTSTKKPVENQDLWEKIKEKETQCQKHGMMIRWAWVPGHQGHQGNERAHDLAQKGLQTLV